MPSYTEGKETCRGLYQYNYNCRHSQLFISVKLVCVDTLSQLPIITCFIRKLLSVLSSKFKHAPKSLGRTDFSQLRPAA